MLNWRRLAVPGAAASLLLAGTAATEAAAVTGPTTYNVWQWNVAGNTVHHGSTTDGLVTVAANSIVNRNTDFASFNELCYGQYDGILQALRTAGWPTDAGNFARFEPSLPAGTAGVCNGDAFGVAIFSKRPLGNADRFTLPADGQAEQRKLLCAPLQDDPHIRFCGTHITTVQTANVSQLNFVLDTVEAYHASGETVLLAGDFNAQPNYGRMNGYYSSSVNGPNNPDNTGHYRELDDNDSANCPGYGEWTADDTTSNTPPCSGTHPKIDMIFVREDTVVGSYSGDSLGISTACTGVTECSDHRILIGTVSVV